MIKVMKKKIQKLIKGTFSAVSRSKTSSFSVSPQKSIDEVTNRVGKEFGRALVRLSER